MPYKDKKVRNSRLRERYRSNPIPFKDRASDGKARMRARNRQIVIKAKDRPCTDCGVKYHPYVMDFDHRPDEKKRGEVSDIASCNGLKVLLAEIAKCDVVCSNCHRLRTLQRRDMI